jgi:hypothetical protein
VASHEVRWSARRCTKSCSVPGSAPGPRGPRVPNESTTTTPGVSRSISATTRASTASRSPAVASALRLSSWTSAPTRAASKNANWRW